MSLPSELKQLQNALSTVIVGQHDLLERLMIALLAGGHVLLEGPPGLAKTTVVHALASGLDAQFQRVQFTPDLMPADLIGGEIYEPSNGSFRFISGPLFHEVLLTDEINRAPPKVQSALLEAMAEHQVTVSGKTYPLPDLFMVLATQNPLDQAGTYPLPEAQLDRFLFKIVLDYPDIEEEVEITRRARSVADGHVEAGVTSVLCPTDILAMREKVRSVFIEPTLERYAVSLVAATRNIDALLPEFAGLVHAGASPRASIALLHAASARAFMQGRDYVVPEDISLLAQDVLRHRITLDFGAAHAGVSADKVILTLLDALPQP